jgi:ADP-heptose:LPS heptosyltransferase
MSLRRNVLIFHQAALGDFIVTWPIAMALSRILPQSRIIYVTHSQKGALAERVLRVESADAEAGWHTLLMPSSEKLALPERSAKLLDAAHTVISFTAGLNDAFAEAIARVAPHAKVTSLDTKRTDDVHVTESLMKQLQGSWPALTSAVEQMLRSVASRGIGFNRTPQRDRIVLHPGAGKEANRWPADYYLELSRRLRDQGKAVRILLGEAELERWPVSQVQQFEAVASVHRPGTLLELLDEIASAHVYVGNDSGPGHLAGIIGVPTISLFTATDPTRWRPLGPRVNVLNGHAIELNDVHELVSSLAETS